MLSTEASPEKRLAKHDNGRGDWVSSAAVMGWQASQPAMLALSGGRASSPVGRPDFKPGEMRQARLVGSTPIPFRHLQAHAASGTASSSVGRCSASSAGTTTGAVSASLDSPAAGCAST